MSQHVGYFPLEGGEDLVTPTGVANPGMLRFSRNYECDTQGKYHRVDGYEAFDGRLKPSEVTITGTGDDDADELALHAAIEAARALIEEVPGDGPVLGVHSYKGVKYAIRDNVAGTAAVMFKATSAGWVECDLGHRINFANGVQAFVEGDTITLGAATATLYRVVVTSGTWAGGDAAGFMSFSDATGSFTTGGAILGQTVGICNAVDEAEANVLLPGGRFEFINHNFRGHTSTAHMYGCDGVNKAFEYDGNCLIFISTGMTQDSPSHIHEHKNHLFLGFSGGSLQHSSIGDPLEWSAVTGAAEFGLGDEIVGMLSMPSVLTIWTRNSTKLLYGTSINDWVLQTHSDESGAIEWSLQKIGDGIYLDDRGITSLAAVQEYGDFAANVISRYVQPYIMTKLTQVSCSMRVKTKNQYRLFFTDKEAITITFDGHKVVGITRQYYEHLPVCTCSGENASGVEELFFGCDDGFVYQMDKGTSFNGEAVMALLRTHYNSLKTPANKKRFRKLTLELTAPLGVNIQVSPDFSYGSEDSQSTIQDFDIQAQGGAWDISSWDSFVWDGPFVGTADARIDGSGTNIALLIVSESIYDPPHTLQGVIVHYDIRGLKR
jgi:hypothetical protein